MSKSPRQPTGMHGLNRRHGRIATRISRAVMGRKRARSERREGQESSQSASGDCTSCGWITGLLECPVCGEALPEEPEMEEQR